ncbi:MAG: SRPBCC family protein [Sandaracinaceae bacterium]|nr:SRPBCC family protein [Sandaracinaceae bacterium]
MEYRAAATIHASPKAIWALLTDAAQYPDWNPTVVRVEGDIALGKKIKVVATVSPERAFPVTVSELVPCERMVWQAACPSASSVACAPSRSRPPRGAPRPSPCARSSRDRSSG